MEGGVGLARGCVGGGDNKSQRNLSKHLDASTSRAFR